MEFGGRTWRLTASCVILFLPENGTSIQEFQQRLLGDIQTGINSGGDCVLLGDEIDKDFQSWTELAAPGKLFEPDVIEMVEDYNRRRKVIVKGLNDIGLPCFEPERGFLCLPLHNPHRLKLRGVFRTAA